MKKIAEIQYITQEHPCLSASDQANMMFKNGIRWVQIRMKNSPKEAIIQEARKALDYAKLYGATVIINDDPELCKEVGAHGVHVGLMDASVQEARRILGNTFLIGATANTLSHIEVHVAQGADYVGLGPYRFTTTKQNLSPILGLDGLKNMAEGIKRLNLTTPVVVVGGITLDDFTDIHQLGLHGVALSTGLLKKYDIYYGKVNFRR
jgi:thiamine-phosphate pyrophosphorylase